MMIFTRGSDIYVITEIVVKQRVSLDWWAKTGQSRIPMNMSQLFSPGIYRWLTQAMGNLTKESALLVSMILSPEVSAMACMPCMHSCLGSWSTYQSQHSLRSPNQCHATLYHKMTARKWTHLKVPVGHSRNCSPVWKAHWDVLLLPGCWELLRQHNCPDLWIGPLPPPPEKKRGSKAGHWTHRSENNHRLFQP